MHPEEGIMCHEKLKPTQTKKQPILFDKHLEYHIENIITCIYDITYTYRHMCQLQNPHTHTKKKVTLRTNVKKKTHTKHICYTP